MPRSALALATVLVTITHAPADDKKVEKIDPAKLVGEWKGKKPGKALPIDLVDVWEFGKGGEFTIRVAQPDDVTNGMKQAVGTYKVNGSAVEVTAKTIELTTSKPGEKPPTEPKADAKAEKMTIEVVKLTDTELHLKVDKDKAEVSEYVRVTADDKDTTVDTTKLVGKWKTKRAATDGTKDFVLVFEFTKTGEMTVHSAPPGDLTKAEKQSEGTYKLKDKKLETTLRGGGDKKGESQAWDIMKLSDTGLTLRNAQEGSGEKGVVFGLERVKDEKKGK